MAFRAIKNKFAYWTRLSVYLIALYAIMIGVYHLLEPLHLSPWSFNIVLYSYALLVWLPLWLAPTHIQIGQQGLRFHWMWSWTGLLSSAWLPWQTISEICKCETKQTHQMPALITLGRALA